ncbi:multidrug transporter [Paenibacillus baekrokdamisoli]|uniref:Multidrug transporter n=1 Tax=Paenibacillus baekrokdamisoli TaxID=1712516 RepID=A0A3G9JB10_9BACL|nr:DMT family transporter [Paenibacillus baekrokdamisoli]MBB3072414.1 drug/metabolite transporter (DMT)-like permease [Paenibacillus baekrokdamisoli]BBH20474.1 multidrug transporter [Paenibacillus baekrokdamisoli]
MKYLFSVLLGAMSYGILSTIVVKAYGQGFELGEVVGSQLLTGFILSWALALFIKLRSKRKGKPQAAVQNLIAHKLTWTQRLMLMAAGAPTAITGLLYYQSLRYIPNSLAIVLLFQFTWIGVLIHAISQRKRPNGIMLLTVAILFGGTLLAAGILEQGLSNFNLLGVALGLLSAVSYSLFIIFSGKAVPSVHPAFRSAWMISGALLLVFILFPPHFLFNGLLWGNLLLFGLLLGLFGAFIPPLLFAVGVPHIGEGMAAILGASELPVAILLSSVVLHEQVSILQWTGVVLVLLGVALPELVKQLSLKSLAGRNGSNSAS